MSELKKNPIVYNIPAGNSFADVLVQGILERTNSDPLELSKYTLLLPSRRACRVLRDAFLRHSNGNAMLLPTMQPIGDVDADEMSLTLSEEALNIPPAISKLERQLLLAKIIQKKDADKNFDQAVALAGELGAFLDEVQTERLEFDELVNIVPDEFAEHWQETLTFLKILTSLWPAILKEQGFIDISERRNLLIEKQIEMWTKNPPTKHIIAAGSTGPTPAATDLLALIAKLPNGEVVLPGLDILLDNDSWGKLDDDHPQYFIKKLLNKIGVERSAVKDWKSTEAINTDRVKLLSEAMRPADTTDKWRDLSISDISETSLAGLTVVNCTTAQEEANTIALIMREAIETPEKTCALITPDRRLARRVAQSLKRWNITVDDSGGQPLTEFPIGSYLMLIAEMAEDNLSPVTLLSFLKHPLLAASMPATKLRDMVQFLDERILRGPRHSGGFEGLKIEAENKGNGEILQWIDTMKEQLSSFVKMMTSPNEYNFRELLSKHVKTSEDLASTLEIDGANRLWHGEAGEAAGKFIGELLNIAETIPEISPEHYISIFGMLLKSNTVRPRFGTHPRLNILGQIESRLYCADMVILGGLNEGSWPKLPGDDPWMSRPMRKQFGLPSPEKDISLAAHDFVQAASAKEVIITRAAKIDGTPTVPARWLLRIETVLNALGLDIPTTKGLEYKTITELMDKPDAIKAIDRPTPCPPINVRPRAMSVTNIEKWMRDPYQIYAKYILNLRAIDDLDEDAGAAKRGEFIHRALEVFIKEHNEDIPKDAKNKLLSFGKAALTDMHIQKEVEAFWWPRFEKVAENFILQEQKWREKAKPYLTEIKGEIDIGKFTITAKADRIDKMNDGTYTIIDYKSGNIPSSPNVKAGLSPQLPLEALILEEGGFKGIKKSAKTSNIMYWKVSGSGQKPVEQKFVKPQKYTTEQIIEGAKQGVADLINCFDNENTPYISCPRMNINIGYTDYEHLSRIKEWGISGEDGEEGGDHE